MAIGGALGFLFCCCCCCCFYCRRARRPTRSLRLNDEKWNEKNFTTSVDVGKVWRSEEGYSRNKLRVVWDIDQDLVQKWLQGPMPQDPDSHNTQETDSVQKTTQWLCEVVDSDGKIFLGSDTSAFQSSDKVIVSFPGQYGRAWNELTKGAGSLKTSCVFLPDENSPGYGVHVPNDSQEWYDLFRGIKRCYCHQLYGQEQKWGCRWFQMWAENTRRAQEAKCSLVVITKEAGLLLSNTLHAHLNHLYGGQIVMFIGASAIL